jgi:hypothetical protein
MVHSARLFPKTSDRPTKKLFDDAFHALMTNGGNGHRNGDAESPGEYFERKWDKMLQLVMDVGTGGL